MANLNLRSLLPALCAASMIAPTSAAAFDKVKSKSEFMQIVQGKNLTIMGISVNVQPNGAIGGKAYGRPVKGEWRWSDGYFCRDLSWGDMDLGPNCQEVKVDGNTIRFQSDKGTGRYADLRIR